jgi:acetyl-CoA carboxylase biotin carboxylase subunit
VGAGTVEFLVDAERNFYFLEMNTRLQVEHPVTEMVTGVDIVIAQIRIACGEKLWFAQDDVVMRGHAIECRIYAEDPYRGFVPSPGRIVSLTRPGGPGVRVDSGVYEGWEVAIFYDPLLAKLVVWGQSRDEAIRRLRRALGEYSVGGIMTNVPLFRAIADDPNFVAGDIDTQYLDRWIADRRAPADTIAGELEADLALVAAALEHRASAQRPAAAVAVDGGSNWKRAGRVAAARS